MDFAKKEMEKYGWKEGKGLGKEEDGIVAALKTKLKFDNAGVGAKPGDEFTNQWWRDVYDHAAKNLEVKEVNGEVKLGVKSGKNTELTTKPASVTSLKKNNNLEYGTFLKTSKLTQEGVKDYEVKGKDKEKSAKPKPKPLTDEELFKACGGRTINQASRFGIYMSGKLSRLERQEKMLLKKMKNVSLSDAPKIEKKVKKIKEEKKTKDATVEPPKEVLTSPLKKKKKKRGTVSFNETVTEYYPPQEDDNVKSSQNKESIVSPLTRNSKNAKDEGIEIDMPDGDLDDTKCFGNVDDISNAERKKLKKKRDEKCRGGATARFLAEIESEMTVPDEVKNNHLLTKNPQSRCKKRKLTSDEDDDQSPWSKTRYVNLNPKYEHDPRFNRTDKPMDELDMKIAKLQTKFQMKLKTEKRLNSVMNSLNICKITE